eukprot:TRINITY_DN2369_c0_g3_i5.p1 TRINITY_DN2369_c0_g3~~TRINITY_DN2369_c0_g3_i5.p1  ORF type:complete len:219 (-),score=37.57 TRINITY_DN2369_c0_g3_i5:155-811(-)
MGIEKMIVSGHSLGGYVATKYAAKYPSNVISLVLISPAAVWPSTPAFEEEMKAMINNFGFIQRNVFKKATAYWVPGKTPLKLLRTLGRVSSIGLKSYVNIFGKLQEDERADLREYLFHILMKPGTGEVAMGYVLERGAFGVDPLLAYLHEFKFPVSIYFGDKDWMARTKPKDFGENPYYLKNSWVKEEIIKDAGHHICLDNPDDLIESISNNLKEMTT